jgi:hypothetical protein
VAAAQYASLGHEVKAYFVPSVFVNLQAAVHRFARPGRL